MFKQLWQYCLSLSLGMAVMLTANLYSAQITVRTGDQLKSGPVIAAKLSPIISPSAKEFLLNRNKDKALVWVFFTDKQVDSKESFDRAAASVKLSDKVLKRRSKVNLGQVVFADLPVARDYIQEIVNLGSVHRRTSKWQNAASFEVPTEKLSEIERLSFVSEIRPLAVGKRQPPPQIDLQKERFDQEKLNPDALNYGSSGPQLIQIGIDKMHNRGFHGEGVTLAILDTGFRKSHEAFAAHYADSRVLAEYDFIFNDGNTANEPIDDPSQWSHGTLIWSVSGGLRDGSIYGPAYQASFLLAKTEDIRSETPIEEDNWVAAVEWADSLGADVMTSSLCYIDWYTQADLDGQTAVTTVQANMCASLGIVLCNAAGNAGPGTGTLLAPADAFNMLTVGAVNSSGTIASFSSRGPTADGRTKPEVCARGVSTWSASSSSDNGYGGANGTSLSTPLVAGAACLLVQARPNFPPQVIRQALMETAGNAATPNNNYGWGIINADAAFGWGAEFSADATTGNAPAPIQFTANTSLTATDWSWSFGDGGVSTLQNPLHQYMAPGTYDVSLTIQSAYGPVSNLKEDYIVIQADTIRFESDSNFAGQQVEISVGLTNTQPLVSMTIPFKYGSVPGASLDSVTKGSRTGYFESLSLIGQDPGNNRYGYRLLANNGGGAPALPAGSGEVLKIFLSLDSLALGGLAAALDSTSFVSNPLSLTSSTSAYTPAVITGNISTKSILRGDANYDFDIDIIDLNFLVNRIFRGGPWPITVQSGDCNGDFGLTILDLNYMVNFIFRGGPPPPTP